MHFTIKILCLAGVLAFSGIFFPASALAADNSPLSQEIAQVEQISWWEQAKAAGAEAWETVKEKAPEVWDETKDKAGEFYDKAKDKAPEIAAKAKDGLDKAQEKTADFLQRQEDEFWERTERQIYGENTPEEPSDSTEAPSIAVQTPAETPVTERGPADTTEENTADDETAKATTEAVDTANNPEQTPEQSEADLLYRAALYFLGAVVILVSICTVSISMVLWNCMCNCFRRKKRKQD